MRSGCSPLYRAHQQSTYFIQPFKNASLRGNLDQKASEGAYFLEKVTVKSSQRRGLRPRTPAYLWRIGNLPPDSPRFAPANSFVVCVSNVERILLL